MSRELSGHIEEIKEYCLIDCQTTDTTNSGSSSFLPSFFSLTVLGLFSLFSFLFSSPLLIKYTTQGRISNKNNEVNHTTTNNIEAL
jgi:hypothetical protein